MVLNSFVFKYVCYTVLNRVVASVHEVAMIKKLSHMMKLPTCLSSY